MKPLSHTFTEINRDDNSSGWHIITPEKNYYVTDLWLTELGWSIDQYSAFIRNHGFAPNPKNSSFVFRAAIDHP